MDPSTGCVLVLDPATPEADLGRVLSATAGLHPGAVVTRGDGWAAIAVGDGIRPVDVDALGMLPGVQRVVSVTTPFRLASREVYQEERPIGVPSRETDGSTSLTLSLGGRTPIGLIVSSRWAKSSETRLALLTPLLRDAGCGVFHAGRMTPSDADDGGVTPRALRGIRDVVHDHGLALCVEVSDAGQIGVAEGLADMLQVGSRNMQDFSLLSEMGATGRPILLKRGAGATVEEFLLAAEYVLLHGNGRVILCESGIRTFDSLRKPRFEINAVPLLKMSTHLPIVADPSQAAPHTGVVPAVARAAVAAGADGLILEVGAEPLRDPEGTAIDIEGLQKLMAELRPIARAVGRTIRRLAGEGLEPMPRDAAEILVRTDRTLGQTIESITGVPPDLEVVGQWHLEPPQPPWLASVLSPDSQILGRCTSYRMGAVRLSTNLSYVDLGRIDPTLAALLEKEQLNLGQLFIDPRIEKRHFEFGTDENAGEIDEVFGAWLRDELEGLRPYVWRRYRAAIAGVVSFVVIEALPTRTWARLLEGESAFATLEGGSR